jgi:aspartyl/asparaginyl-tRNA synthetase
LNILELKNHIVDFFDKEGYYYKDYPYITRGESCCENHTTAYKIEGKPEFMRQTAQVMMELDVRSKKIDRVWTWGTSFRDEPKAGDGRHLREFDLAEFESLTSSDPIIAINHLIALEKRFLDHIANVYGFEFRYREVSYEDTIFCTDLKFGDDIDEEAEHFMLNRERPVLHAIAICNYPESLCHFTMSKGSRGTCQKVDVILAKGGETIGSAVRSHDPDYLKTRLYSSEMYKGLVARGMPTDAFDEYFSIDLTTPAFGGGIGIGRLVKWIEHMVTCKENL